MLFMKIIHLFFFLCSLFACAHTTAQTAFAPTSSEWYHSHHDGYYHSYYSGDTTIKGHICSKIVQDAVVPSSSWASSFPPVYTYVSGDTVLYIIVCFRS
jgi:hypothetical protein